MATLTNSRLSHRLLALSLSLTIASSVAITFAPAASAQNQQAAILNNDGVKALNAGNFQLAIQKFEDALKQQPGYKYAIDNLAIAYNNAALKASPKEALKLFHKALALNPSNATTQQNLDAVISNLGKNPRSFKDRVDLATQARRGGEFEGAIVEYQAALRIQNDAKLHEDLGDVLRIRDHIDEAIMEYKSALSAGLQPSDLAMVNVKLGQAYQAKKDLPNAIASFGEAIKYKSDDREVLDALINGWEEALRENPQAPENHIGLGQAYQYKGDFGQAEAEYKQALMFDRNNQIARKLLAGLDDARKGAEITKHINNGVDLQTRKNYTEAIKEYTLALQADPKNVDAWVDIGSALQAKEDYDRALEAYNRVLQIDPKNAIAKQGIDATTKAKAAKELDSLTANAGDLYKAGKYREALDAYRRLVQKTPDDAGVHFNIAASLQQLGDLEGAIAEYKQAVNLDGKNEQYQQFLEKALDKKADPIIASAVAAHKEKDYARAIDLYQQAISLRPKRAELYYNLASAYYSRQQYELANAQYKKAMELDPKGQINDLWFIGTIAEHFNKGYDALNAYKKYLAQAPTGDFSKPAKERYDALMKNPGDTVKIKSEDELARIKDAADAYQTAVKLQQDKQYDQALPLYQKAMQLQPKESAYPYAISSIFLAKGDYDQALSFIDQAIHLDATNKDYPKYKGVITEQKAQKLVDDAVAKQQANDFRTAIGLYQQATQLVPKNARVWTDLATAFYAADDFTSARAAYQKAVELDPKNESSNWYALAAIDENYHKGGQALDEYRKFITANPTDKSAPEAKARIAALTKNIADCKPLPTRAEALATKQAQDIYDEGVKLQQAKQLDEAIAQYQKAAQIAPKEGAYVFAIGSAYQEKGDLANAGKYYSQAVALDPKNAEFKKYLDAVKIGEAGPIVDQASAKYTAGDFQGAIAMYRQALAIVPNDPAIHTDIAAAMQAADDFANARVEYQKAYDLDPKSQVDVLYFLGALDENFNDGYKALQRYRDYVTKSPKGKFVEYAKARVDVLAKNPANVQKLQTAAERASSAELAGVFDDAVKLQQASNYDAAEQKYQQLLQKNPNDAGYNYAIGTNYQAKGDLNNAIKYYEIAAARDPGNGDYKKVLQTAREGKAAVLIDQGVQKYNAKDFAGAIEMYKQALAVNPKNAKLHTNIGVAYQSMDNFAAARDEYQKGFDLDPKGEIDNLYFMGPLDETLGKGKIALSDYTKYLQYAPKGQYAKEANARYQVLYFDPNKIQKMQTQQEAQQLTAANDAFNEAVKLQQDGKIDEAIAKYGEALKVQGTADSIYYSRGTAWQAKGDLDKAIADYEQAVRLNGKEASYKKVLKDARTAKAGPLLEEAYKKQTTLNDLNGAIDDYLKALRVDDDASTHLNLGTAYQANKALPKAEQEYLRAVSMDPKQADAHYYLGTVYEAMGQPKKAALEYRKYVEVAPSGQYANDAKSRLKIVH